MGWLGLVGMGWLMEGVFATGGNCVRHAKLAECTSIYGSHINQPAVIETYVGSGIIT